MHVASVAFEQSDDDSFAHFDDVCCLTAIADERSDGEGITEIIIREMSFKVNKLFNLAEWKEHLQETGVSRRHFPSMNGSAMAEVQWIEKNPFFFFWNENGFDVLPSIRCLTFLEASILVNEICL